MLWDCLKDWLFRYFWLLFLGHPQLCGRPQACWVTAVAWGTCKMCSSRPFPKDSVWVGLWGDPGICAVIKLLSESLWFWGLDKHGKSWIRAPACDHWCWLGLVDMKLRDGSQAQLLPWPQVSRARPDQGLRGLKAQPSSPDFWVLPSSTFLVSLVSWFLFIHLGFSLTWYSITWHSVHFIGWSKSSFGFSHRIVQKTQTKLPANPKLSLSLNDEQHSNLNNSVIFPNPPFLWTGCTMSFKNNYDNWILGKHTIENCIPLKNKV